MKNFVNLSNEENINGLFSVWRCHRTKLIYMHLTDFGKSQETCLKEEFK
jgi:hypothetical protein